MGERKGVQVRVQGVSEWSHDSRHVHPIFDLAGVHEERAPGSIPWLSPPKTAGELGECSVGLLYMYMYNVAIYLVHVYRK